MYPGLCYAHKNLNFCMKLFFFWKMFVWVLNSICVEEKTDKFLLSPSKNASHTISIYGNYMFIIFLTKSFSFLLSTIHRLLCRNKKILWKFDDTILAKCLKLVWLVFFIDLVYEIVWLAFLVFGVQQKMSEKGSWQEEQSSLDRLWIWLNKNIQNWDQICGEQHFNWLMIREENQIELKLS